MEDNVTHEFMEQMYYLTRHLGIQPSEVRRLTAYERKWLVEKHLAEKMLEAGRVQRLMEKASEKGATVVGSVGQCAGLMSDAETTYTVKKKDEVVPLVIKTGAGQSANLTEWQNPVGHVLSHSGNTPTMVVKGSVSQTANLQEWQNSAGTVVACVTNDGEFKSFKKRDMSGFIKWAEKSSPKSTCQVQII
jgi:hypothetical protein